MSNMRQEYSSFGGTDYSVGSYSILQENGSNLTGFKYQTYKILDIKPKIPGLPQAQGDSITLAITLFDKLIDTCIIMYYSIFSNSSIISRSNRFVNHGSQDLILAKAMSVQIDFDHNDFKMLQLDGAWARERNITYRDVEQGRTIIESTLGASSHIQNPLVCIMDNDANEKYGDIYAASIIYSGSYIGTLDVASHKRTRMSIGIHDQNFAWNLTNGNEFWTPEAILNYSPHGLNNLSQEFHAFIKSNIMRIGSSETRTPFITNNWEATYFDFDGRQIIDIAREAKACGCEMFVLDDGWFGERDSDTCALGD